MPALPLTIQPNPILHTPSTDLALVKLSQYQQLGSDMIATMLEHNGIGLAAPQVGKNLNLFVINKEATGNGEHLILCNPNITFQSAASHVMEEGCLSCPKTFGDVRRPEKIRVKAYTLTGEKKIFKAKGLLAKVFQHEIDHLRGTLIIDKFER
jgi:peptide deformylase